MSEALREQRKIEANRGERLALAVTAACACALSSGIIAALVYLVLALASMFAARSASAQTAPAAVGVRPQAGIGKVEADGELTSALEAYREIAADRSALLEVRARALLQLTGCDEKLGRLARMINRQIIRGYAIQPDGRHVLAMNSSYGTDDLWVLHNFEPPVKK